MKTLLAFAVFALLGCGGSGRLPVYPVKGAMTFDRKATAGAMVVFHPVGGDAVAADLRPSAVVQNDGTFAPTTYNHGDGLPAGDYALTVFWPRPPGKEGDESSGNRLPARYDRPESSGLKITVEKRANELQPIALTR